MKKYLVKVTETVHHEYEVEATSEDGALDAYDKLTEDELAQLDLDGSTSWDVPWDVEVVS